MLNLKETKKLLNDPNITDGEALKIRDDFHALAEIIFEQWQRNRKKIKEIKTLDRDLDKEKLFSRES